MVECKTRRRTGTQLKSENQEPRSGLTISALFAWCGSTRINRVNGASPVEARVAFTTHARRRRRIPASRWSAAVVRRRLAFVSHSVARPSRQVTR